MILSLVMNGLRRGRTRFICAVLGIAIACGSVVFMSSLTRTNSAQSERRAQAMLETLPLEATSFAQMALDYRPDGHVMQGPPMMVGAQVSTSVEGDHVIVTRALFAQRRLAPPDPGSHLKIIGRHGTYEVVIDSVIDWEMLARGMPNMFVSAEFAALASAEEWKEFTIPAIGELSPMLRGDEQRRMDYARPLLLVAAVLTALSLLVNSLLLSVESNRPALSVLRMVGLTRGGVAMTVALEAVFSALCGSVLGASGAVASLWMYVAADPIAFPSGIELDWMRIFVTLAASPVIAIAASLFAFGRALNVRPVEAPAMTPNRRRGGMMTAFALGFAAFVAVEVWGASLMRGFIPSVEWPDAIVSILPVGVSSFEVGKLRDIEGVSRISELVPRQLYLDGDSGKDARSRPNALFLAAEWLPQFDFIEGDFRTAEQAVFSSDAVVITRMMSNALGLHVGDRLACVNSGRGGKSEKLSFPIAGVVDLNWHMVTSRGLVRGLNRMPQMTIGPVFCSLDTMGTVDPRTYMTDPAMSANMTHLWVEYERGFLDAHGVFESGRIIEREIAARLGVSSGSTVRLHARDEIADGTLAHGSDLIGQAARVPFVFLAILSIGFIAMLVAEADARRRELIALRSIGATRMQLAWLLTRSALRTALIGMAFALPCGALAGWLVSFSTASIWPGMPHWFVIPWPVIAEGALGAVVFALAFAIPTAVVITQQRMKRQGNSI